MDICIEGYKIPTNSNHNNAKSRKLPFHAKEEACSFLFLIKKL